MESVENRHYKWAYSRNTLERHNSETEDGINNRRDDLMLMISKFSPTGYKYKSISRNQQNDHYAVYSNKSNGNFPVLNAKNSTAYEAKKVYSTYF